MKFLQAQPSALPALAAARRRRWRVVLLLLAVLAIMVAVSGPAYQRFRLWRARGLAEQAERLLASEQPEPAAVKARAAFALAPAEPKVLRAMARLCAQQHIAAAGDFWKAYLSAAPPTMADRREATRTALQSQQLDLATEQIDVLLKAEPNAPETLQLATELALQTGDGSAALEYARRWLEQQPRDPAAGLMRARLLFMAGDPARRAEGKKALRELAARPERLALVALLTLATDPALSPAEGLWIAQALEAHASAAIEHRLAAIALRGRFAPEQRPALFDEAVARFDHGSPEERAALGRWLELQGQPERVLALFSPGEALARPEFFVIRVDALSELGRWNEIQQLLLKENVPLDPFYRAVFQARAAREQHDDRAAETHWRSALLAARQSPSFLVYLAQYAERIHAMDVAESAWWQLARMPAFTAKAYRGLVPLLDAEGRTRELREVLREVARLSPADRAPRNDVAYLDLLLEENVADATRTAELLVQESPQTLAFRNTLALARLRGHDPVAAEQAYGGLKAPWEQLPAPVQAVRLATFLANHQLEQARTELPATRVASLKPEEKALIAPAER